MRHSNIILPDKKICGVCKIEKEAKFFQIRKKPNGYMWLRLECNACMNERRRKRMAEDEELKNKRYAINSKYYEENRKKLLEYNKEYRKKNKEQHRELGRKKYRKNSEKIKERRKEYYRKNREHHINVVNEYQKNNLPIVRERQRKNHAKRKKTDLNYSITKVLRTRVGVALKNKANKAAKTAQLVGCSMPELILHIESQFKEGMSWDNYGFSGWHIDHIKPLSKFDMTKEEEQFKAFNWKNLQPLWWWENLEKSNKIHPKYNNA